MIPDYFDLDEDHLFDENGKHQTLLSEIERLKNENNNLKEVVRIYKLAFLESYEQYQTIIRELES